MLYEASNKTAKREPNRGWRGVRLGKKQQSRYGCYKSKVFRLINLCSAVFRCPSFLLQGAAINQYNHENDSPARHAGYGLMRPRIPVPRSVNTVWEQHQYITYYTFQFTMLKRSILNVFSLPWAIITNSMVAI